MKHPKLTLVKAITKELKKKVTTSTSSNEAEEEMVNCYKKKPVIIHSKDKKQITVKRDWKRPGIYFKLNEEDRMKDPHCEIDPSLMRKKKVVVCCKDDDDLGPDTNYWDEEDYFVNYHETKEDRGKARNDQYYIQEFYNYKPNSTVFETAHTLGKKTLMGTPESRIIPDVKIDDYKESNLPDRKIKFDWNQHVAGWNADVDISVKKGDIVEILRRSTLISKDKRWREDWREMWEKIPDDTDLEGGRFHVRKVGGDGDVGLVPVRACMDEPNPLI